jgi:hypothetical protein
MGRTGLAVWRNSKPAVAKPTEADTVNFDLALNVSLISWAMTTHLRTLGEQMTKIRSLNRQVGVKCGAEQS